MYNLGKKSALPTIAQRMQEIEIQGRPVEMPELLNGHLLICEFDRNGEEVLYFCGNLDDAQFLYDMAGDNVKWYSLMI
ncbi:hypothetical protein A2415_01530 [candidate division WWE3 bacterium RIFOXYC1_FULL_39_7]|uniref:Uncharacterized protein n=2 Tax=Katanobacteria TaxID=422282 RepID=A0A1F4X514_UNCKA|nr:MAG: hypothetical protein A2415_01530 [candidate division WWE3 bacterium RIFOXYC1_FULL_39_7]OGC76782.1 MAG: hypothetical protein A2619_00455 [candidate division WWE3 bacterium RIFOXYD1_FULL_39_9]